MNLDTSPYSPLAPNDIIHVEGKWWHIGRRLAWKYREQRDPYDYPDKIDELHEVYEAVYSEDPLDEASRVPCILKVKKHCAISILIFLAYIDSDRLDPWAEGNQFKTTTEIDREIENLDHLTEKGCTSTPKLLCWSIHRQSPDDLVPGGYIALIMMERLPGRDLQRFNEFDDDEKNRVRLAFLGAIWYA